MQHPIKDKYRKKNKNTIYVLANKADTAASLNCIKTKGYTINHKNCVETDERT